MPPCALINPPKKIISFSFCLNVFLEINSLNFAKQFHSYEMYLHCVFAFSERERDGQIDRHIHRQTATHSQKQKRMKMNMRCTKVGFEIYTKAYA